MYYLAGGDSRQLGRRKSEEETNKLMALVNKCLKDISPLGGWWDGEIEAKRKRRSYSLAYGAIGVFVKTATICQSLLLLQNAPHAAACAHGASISHKMTRWFCARSVVGILLV